jgi:PAS domain S-box-containing protein
MSDVAVPDSPCPPSPEPDEAQRRQREFAALLDGVPHGLFLLDPEGHIILCNPPAARFFQEVCGLGPEQLLGADIWQACPEVADSTFAKESRLAQQEQRTFQTETYFPGLRRWFQFHGAHSAAGLCVAMQDVTERVQLERSLRNRADELTESNRGKEEFLLQLAHDLRNCLAPIRNALHLWGTLAGGSPAEDEARQMAEEELRHTARLLGDLLKLSHLAPDDLRPKLARLDLVAVAVQGMHAALSSPAARGRRISVQLPAESLPLEGDQDMLAQVLAHLLDNAVKFTRPGGQITVEVAREGPEALLRVRDDGIGIAPALLPRVFNIFMRSNPDGDRTRGGVGVGLALVRRLVELHGGQVEAHSAGPGRGSEFVVRLPALVETEIADTPGQPKIRVLIVDDDKQAAESMALLLRMWGYETRVALDARLGLEAARAYSPRVVLLDIGMPGMDGYEVARRLRAQRESKGALLVAVTGYGEEGDQRRAREAGFDYHILKPADPNDLRELLKIASSFERLNVPMN